MPSLLSLLTTGLSLAPLASSTKIVKFINHCPYNIWFWEVGPAASHIDGSNAYRSMVPANGGSIVHNMVDTERLGSGLSLKIRDLPYYAVAPAGIIQVEYHLEGSKGAMWYDLSAVDCDLNVGPENARYCREYHSHWREMMTDGAFSAGSRWHQALYSQAPQQEGLFARVLQQG
jgi:hypothetical protein